MTRTPDPPIVQFSADPGVIDLAWGHPDPTLLPTHLLADAARRTLDRYGPDALAYGAPHGPGPLRAAIRERLRVVDGRTPTIGEILITAGASGGLDQAATLLCQPGDVVLVESPTYHLAVRILRDHPLELVPVPAGPDGLDVGAVARVASDLRRQGRQPRLLYAIPTFANPTGATITVAAREQLADILAAEDLLLVEDDTYRELWYDEPPPPSVWSVAGGEHVVRLGSFSKTLAPGLRLGYMTATANVVDQFAGSGVLDSGGANAHLVALVVADLLDAGEYSRHVDDLRAAYRARRDALASELNLLGYAFCLPAGGYFIWLDVGVPTDAETMRQVRAEGMNFVSGAAFSLELRRSSHARLSFSRYPPEALREAAQRLARGAAKARRIPR